MIAPTYIAPSVGARLLRLSQLRNRERATRRNAIVLHAMGSHILGDAYTRIAQGLRERADLLEKALS